MASKLNLWPKVKGMLLIEVMERNASSNAEIGRLWKFDGYHDSLGEVDRSPLGDDAFKLLQEQKIFWMGQMWYCLSHEHLLEWLRDTPPHEEE
ncbi:hypothetical protein QJS10_CPA06g00971 [Acorus calamus]|uniref:Uncharacterized protein n=1 Tax=Acorus calamus TaxID=4465 RepID=A0AAV9ER73_ACOCL|nr:hypothetical protein QJS10_CPA06g00971 [Acorus calamus]